MDKKTIAICLEKFDIGGVETFAFTQIKYLMKTYNVIVLAKKGIYTDVIKDLGVKCFVFDFEAKNYIDMEAIGNIIKIFKKYNVSEVHINQFLPISHMMLVCINLNIPYVAYLHMSEKLINDNLQNGYIFFENQILGFKDILNIYYNNAYKIIGVNKGIIDYVCDRYSVNKNKCVLINNSIDFNEYESKFKVESIKNILIISRMSKEKKVSILNSIDLFKSISENNNDLKLHIVGDGEVYEEIKTYVSDKLKDNQYEFYGSTTNTKDAILKCDAVIGMGRCVLEAVALKKLVILTNYTNNVELLDNNISTYIDSNFVCNEDKCLDNTSVIEKLLKLDNNEIKNIIDNYYIVAKERLSVEDNIDKTMCDTAEFNYDIDYKDCIIKLLNINNKLGSKLEKTENVSNELWVYKLTIDKKYEDLENQYKSLQDKYNKTLFRRLVNIFKK